MLGRAPCMTTFKVEWETKVLQLSYLATQWNYGITNA